MLRDLSTQFPELEDVDPVERNSLYIPELTGGPEWSALEKSWRKTQYNGDSERMDKLMARIFGLGRCVFSIWRNL
jgi:hypothetical protein